MYIFVLFLTCDGARRGAGEKTVKAIFFSYTCIKNRIVVGHLRPQHRVYCAPCAPTITYVYTAVPETLLIRIRHVATDSRFRRTRHSSTGFFEAHMTSSMRPLVPFRLSAVRTPFRTKRVRRYTTLSLRPRYRSHSTGNPVSTSDAFGFRGRNSVRADSMDQGRGVVDKFWTLCEWT